MRSVEGQTSPQQKGAPIVIIFDHFETVADAATFAAGVLDRDASLDLVITTKQLDQVDPFPVELDGVIVYVERDGSDDGLLTAELDELAVAAGGRWAGT